MINNSSPFESKSNPAWNPVRQVARRIALAVLALGFLSASLLAELPTTNPVAERYNGPEGYPLWTDAVAWDNVIDMAAYDNGANDFEKFENARDELHAAGGVVLYYPAGVYTFDLPDNGYGPGMGPNSRGLMLKSGVVIRGEAPAEDQWARAPGDSDAEVDGQLELPVRFEFPFQKRGGGQVPADWSFIGIIPSEGEALKDIHNVGICWVNTNGATIYFGAQSPWSATYNDGKYYGGRTKTDWPGQEGSGETWAERVPDGTFHADLFCGTAEYNAFEGSGAGRLVMGVVLDNATVVNDFAYPNGRQEGRNGGPETFYNYRFTGRISVYGSNVFIANNVIPIASKNFVYGQVMGSNDGKSVIGKRQILFNYAYSQGVDVNKSLLGLAKPTQPGKGYYPENVIIRDNWVFNRGNTGFHVSGQWMVLQNNHNERYHMGYVVPESYQISGYETATDDNRLGNSLDGFNYQASGENSDDYLSRGYDLGGRNQWVDNCTVINTGSSGNDGEGLLCQRHNNFEVYSWAWTDNRQWNEDLGPGTSGETSYMAPYDVHVFGLLQLRNESRGSIGVVKGVGGDSGNLLLDHTLSLNESASGSYPTASGADAEEDKAGQAAFAAVLDSVQSDHTDSVDAPVNVAAAWITREAGAEITAESVACVEVTWEDTADNELGYRVDRKMGDGGWSTIAYRPRQSLLATLEDAPTKVNAQNGEPRISTDPWSDTPIDELNPPVWRDYTARTDMALAYRVAAINAADDDTTGVSEIVSLDALREPDDGGNGGETNPVLAYFPDAVDVGGGYYESGWFGTLVATDFPLIYHFPHGWMICSGEGGDSVMLWTDDMQWLWTSPDIYPFLYRFSDQTWLYFFTDTDDPRWFYNYNTGELEFAESNG